MIFKIIFACIAEDVRNEIGNTDLIRRTIRRARRKNVPEESRSMQFVLPEKWKNCKINCTIKMQVVFIYL